GASVVCRVLSRTWGERRANLGLELQLIPDYTADTVPLAGNRATPSYGVPVEGAIERKLRQFGYGLPALQGREGHPVGGGSRWRSRKTRSTRRSPATARR